VQIDMVFESDNKRTFISVRDLQFSYHDTVSDREIPVLRSVNLEINKGEYVAILGHNGSGKSTFAKLLNMVLEPSAGSIVIDGMDVTAPDVTEDDVIALRKKIGMVFQNPDNQLVATVVEEDVAFGPENLGLPSDEIRRRVDKALSFVHMEKYAKHEPHRLSGGQKQRVAIAGILAMMPECVIFDESTSMLDPEGRQNVLELMGQLNREKGITVLDITHDMTEASMAGRIVVLNNGRFVMDGKPAEIFSRGDELKQMGLDVPQFVAMYQGLKQAGIPLPDRLNASVQDCIEAITAYYRNL